MVARAVTLMMKTKVVILQNHPVLKPSQLVQEWPHHANFHLARMELEHQVMFQTRPGFETRPPALLTHCAIEAINRRQRETAQLLSGIRRTERKVQKLVPEKNCEFREKSVGLVVFCCWFFCGGFFVGVVWCFFWGGLLVYLFVVAVVVLVACLLNVLATSLCTVCQGRICSDNFTSCQTETEVADQTFYFIQSQYTDTGPTNHSADPVSAHVLQGSHWSVNLCHWYEEITAKSRKNHGESGNRTPRLPPWRRTP